MADINTPILSLKTLNVDDNGASGSHIHLSGVVPGFINSILRAMGIAGSTDLRMNASYLELRTGSAKGQSSWFVPTGSLSSVQGGYRKEFLLLPIAAFLFFASIIGDIAIAAETGNDFSFGFTWIGIIFAIVIPLIYFFTKTLYFEIESGGGMSARIQFKGAINLDKVEQALVVMQALIAKAQFDGDVLIMGKISNLVIPETPVQQVLQQEVLPQTDHPVDEPTLTPLPAVSQTVDAPTPTPLPAVSQAVDDPTPPPLPAASQPVDEPTPTPLPAVSQPVVAPTPVPTTTEVQAGYENDSRFVIYQKITQHGHQIGTFEEFNNKMNVEQSRLAFHSLAIRSNMPIGNWEEFNSKMS
ncbi:hypothetical protein N9O16_01745 [Candidatus Poseidoniaceae archaeon]|nr:hypothetical protein [Candidatus Poseidoniaceae archaeon]